MKTILLGILMLILGSGSCFSQIQMNLAGKSVDSYPGFIYTRSFNWDDPVAVGLDPTLYDIDFIATDVYIVIHKTVEEWTTNPELIDARGSSQSHTFSGITLGDNYIVLEDTEALQNMTGARSGFGYDIVVDTDEDGMLSEADFIDGYDDNSAGLYLVNNMELPGPYAVDSIHYEGSFWNTFDVFYPSNIAELEPQPLVVISHGWTHEYWFYSYLGNFLSSYGYVVMMHRNEVGNGGALATETASQTALENIDVFFDNEATLNGGILNGKIRHDQIVHTGHSTGGECVVRAYKRLFDGDYISNHITHEDIVLVNSLAPVAFLSPVEVHPEGANYHQFLSGADTDVSGAPIDGYQQALSIYERGYGNKQVTYIHGAGHSDLHGADDFPWAEGPDLIGKEAAHTIVKPYFLALCELYTRNNIAMRDYFTRNKNEFRPSNISDTLKVSGEYRDAITQENFVIDDFQTEESLEFSSSGGIVLSDLFDRYELLMQDHDGTFTWDDEQWSNGMTRSRFTDNPRCGVLGWEAENRNLLYAIPEENMDWSLSEFLSFRTCQITRHPLNIDDELTFDVMLTDDSGASSTINIGNYGTISKPYPKGAGEDGYLTLCLEEGTYTIVCEGSTYPEEVSWVIPDYIEGIEGTYELEIGPGDPCTEIEVLMYDSWGDGWNGGSIEFFNSEEESVGSGMMLGGSGPDFGYGWQNEFYTNRMRLTDFQADNSGLDLSTIVSLTFLFGPDHGNSSGAIGLDDIELTGDALTFDYVEEEISLNELTHLVYPNPMKESSTLYLDNSMVNYHIQVLSIDGKVVRDYSRSNSGNLQIDRGSLSPGIYYIKIKSAKENTSLKLVIE